MKNTSNNSTSSIINTKTLVERLRQRNARFIQDTETKGLPINTKEIESMIVEALLADCYQSDPDKLIVVLTEYDVHG